MQQTVTSEIKLKLAWCRTPLVPAVRKERHLLHLSEFKATGLTLTYGTAGLLNQETLLS